MSAEEKGYSLWLAKNHGKEHPDVTDCDDRELAFEVVKAMQTDGLDWGEGYRPRQALAEDVDRWLGNLDGAAASDRRNGVYCRNLLSELLS